MKDQALVTQHMSDNLSHQLHPAEHRVPLEPTKGAAFIIDPEIVAANMKHSTCTARAALWRPSSTRAARPRQRVCS